ncbi:nucleoside hydrolase [Paenibacillus nasutitermitis]|uniref:Nucleoside hydrolase n=1 Tax=Paenibacillus nasutitermitis TaxID=1652958 RepID=A0A916ZEL9_9BACL|nr:nucleoside hydrolase [Paenibacillus nasutitermitis]GGD90364.1 nucleoside hydrolase [Paenibacillus nasutitermitis]
MPSTMDSRKRVIIDTDIGDDIDDALALFLALKSPELMVLGVTTVFKNTYRRAQIVSSLLRGAGHPDIPVIPGAGRPLANRNVYGAAIAFDEPPHQFLEEMNGEAVAADQTAAEFIIETILRSEHPVTLITLGALTNIALALRVKPEIKTGIEKIVVMGGAYGMNVSEYNFSCDPEAARVVFEAGVKIIAVGLDVTFQCLLSEEQTAQIRASSDPTAQLVMRMREYWQSPHIYLHDPLAVAVAYCEDLVKLERRKIDIETQGQYTRGMSINLSGMNWHQEPGESDIWVCTEVDSRRFVEMYVQRVLQRP